MTTTTIFGDVADNNIRSADATYAIARTGGALAVFASLKVGQDISGVWCVESLFEFDTSGLTGAVLDAILSLWLNNAGAEAFVAEVRIKDWGATVDTGDWVSGVDLGSLTLVASIPSTGIGATGAYKDFTDVALAANINQAGFTRLLMNSDQHRLGNAPTSTQTLTFADADTAGTTSDPKLTVTTGAPIAIISGSVLT